MASVSAATYLQCEPCIHFRYTLLPVGEFIFANWRNQIQQLAKMNLPAGIRSFGVSIRDAILGCLVSYTKLF